MMKPTNRTLSVVLMPWLAGQLAAGEPVVSEPIPEPAPSGSGDWCEWLSNKPGTLYKNSENPLIQEFGVFGRFQWQAAYLRGEDVNGYEFSDDYTEVRRFRLGASVKFLSFLELKGNVNLVDDGRPSGGDLDWDYQDVDELLLKANLKKAFGMDGLDKFEIAYGRHKFALGYEAIESSKNLLTVERSAISNKTYESLRPTALLLSGEKGAWSVDAALYSTDANVDGENIEGLGGWNDGLAYYLGIGYKASEELSFYWDLIYNDADAVSGDDSLWPYEWATALSIAYESGAWGMHTDFYYGDNGDAGNGVTRASRQGEFWGVVVMPYYWIVENKLQAVVRYQYAGASEDEGIRTNSRYFRRDHGPVVDVNSGRGDQHQSLYAGLNWLLCGHNLKFQTGLEYDWLDAPGAGTRGDASALTAWFAFRSFF